MEGLFFEASGTTPYHFLTDGGDVQAELQPGARAALRQQRRRRSACRYMQALGVRYVMVRTDEAKAQAAGAARARAARRRAGRGRSTRSPTPTSSSRSTVQPVVVEQRAGDQRERNLELGTSWFQHRDEWAAMPGRRRARRLAAHPRRRRREPPGAGSRPAADDPDTRGKQVDIVVPGEPIEPVDAAAGRRSATSRSSEQDAVVPRRPGRRARCSSRSATSRTGRSTAPRARTAIAPNMMVVVPTEQRRRADTTTAARSDLVLLRS